MSTNSQQKSFPVTWDQFHRDSRALAWRLASIGPFDALVAITRGGLVPAAIVARELNIRTVETVAVKSYDHQSKGDIRVLKPITAEILGSSSRGTLTSPMSPRFRAARTNTSPPALIWVNRPMVDLL